MLLIEAVFCLYFSILFDQLNMFSKIDVLTSLRFEYLPTVKELRNI